VNALQNVIGAVVPGGTVLDLQTVRPPPRVEAEGRLVCELDAAAFYERADANDRVLLAELDGGVLLLEAEERFDVFQRWPSGAALMAALDLPRSRKLPASMRPAVEAITGECAIREACRTRRIRRR
jgi:hypothetical protein